ncbi:MAG TPA: hypothetical protein VKE92_01670, partial [Anaerolineales bacterium]|nr:hypothetical protein [Anaerolineales bacterium]
MRESVCKRYDHGCEVLHGGRPGLRAVLFAGAIASISIACIGSGIAQEIEFGDTKSTASDISAHSQIHRTINSTTIAAKETISAPDAGRLPLRVFAA